jgi:hypothetical protein
LDHGLGFLDAFLPVARVVGIEEFLRGPILAPRSKNPSLTFPARIGDQFNSRNVPQRDPPTPEAADGRGRDPDKIPIDRTVVELRIIERSSFDGNPTKIVNEISRSSSMAQDPRSGANLRCE